MAIALHTNDLTRLTLLMSARDAEPEQASNEVSALVVRARSGELEAFDRLMQLYEVRVRRIAVALLNEPGDAADAAQEAFLRVYRSLARVDITRPFDPWVYRITVNVCRSLNRKRGFGRFLSLDSLLEAGRSEPRQPSLDPVEDERRRLLAEGIRRLPKRERAVVVLRDVEGLSSAEVAKTLKVSEATVRSHASRARAKLRDFVTARMRRRS